MIENIKIAIQAIILIPLLIFVSYVGFWLSIIAGPFIVGTIFFIIGFVAVKEYREMKANGEFDD